jgi:type II secretory pathway component PulK
VLIIVLWIAFGLVSLALYFAHSMSLELRTADNHVASTQAEQAIAGAARYVSNVLATAELPGTLPDPLTYQREAVPVGDAAFWLLGRSDGQGPPDQPFFGLTDEAAKLNLNTATREMLEMLPRMTPELAAAIIDWRDTDSDVTSGGAEDEIYQRLNPAYRCKNAPFESIDELRLVYGMDMVTLFGEDANLNGVLDPNENDGDAAPPEDNRDGRLDPGILEYVTVYSREPNTRTNGEARVNVAGTDQQQLAALLQEKFGADRANQILQRFSVPAGGGAGPGGGAGSGGGRGGPSGGGAGAPVAVRSVLEFFILSGMTADEFAQIERDLTVSSGNATEGLVNVNTASEAVLACIPGIGPELAPSLVSYRQSNSATRTTMAWVVEVLGQTNAIQAGPYLTGASYQFAADVAAVGQYGRGYQRVKFIFDTSEEAPKILYRHDLTHLGWALGKDVRQNLLLAKDKR